MEMDTSSYDVLQMNNSSEATSSNPEVNEEVNDATETSPSDDEILLEPTEEELKREQLKERMREVSFAL